MREIINVQLGQCGNSVGQQFLEKIAQEHGINSNGEYVGNTDYQRQRINVYFNELQNSTYTARTVLADLEPATIDFVRGTPMGRLYDPDNFVVDVGSAGNNWAVGYYGKGFEMIERLMDVVRKEAEGCDHLQGFQLLHSIGGGTGSGLGCLLLERIKSEFGNRIVQNFPIFPSSKVSDIVVEPYNAVLSINCLAENVELCNVIENEALFDICKKKRKLQYPHYINLNEIVSTAISCLTCDLRFPGQINSSLRKQAVNLVPFPRLHFFSNSVLPLQPLQDRARKLTPIEIVSELFEISSFLNTANPTQGRYATASVTFRGTVSSLQAEIACKNVINKNSSYFVQWIPDNIQCSLCDISLPRQPISGVLTGSNNSIQSGFKKLQERFNSLFRRKTFLHRFIAQGMDQMEFTEAESNQNCLISQYQWRCDASAEQEDQQEECSQHETHKK